MQDKQIKMKMSVCPYHYAKNEKFYQISDDAFRNHIKESFNGNMSKTI